MLQKHEATQLSHEPWQLAQVLSSQVYGQVAGHVPSQVGQPGQVQSL